MTIFRVLFLLSFIPMILFAQDQNNAATATPDQKDGQWEYYNKSASTEKIRKRFYLGVGGGLNNYVGIAGGNIEVRLGNANISAVAGTGLGSWGYKLSTGFRFYFKYPLKFAFNVSYSMATGLPKTPLTLEVIDPNSSTGVTSKEVMIQLKPVHLVNLTFLYFFKMGPNNRFSIEAGYSIAMNPGNNYKVLDPGVKLDPDSGRLLNFIEPGGIVVAVNFCFGLF